MHVCPAAAKMPAMTPIAAFETSASSKTMFGLFPPSSRVEPMNRPAVAEAMADPVRVDPVKEIFASFGLSTSACPASAPRPVTTLTTPAGNPASSASSARRRIVREVYSLGLITAVFPAASAGASFDSVSVIGEFHGVMSPTTPSASRCVKLMTSGEFVGICDPCTLSASPPK